jgi:protein gp37
MAMRLQKMQPVAYANGFKVTCHPKRLEIPLRRKVPTMYFVCSMSDLFHEDVPYEFIVRMMQVMVECPQHTFQLLTKRPECAARWFREWWRPDVRNYFKRGGHRYLRPRLFLRRPGCSECRYFFVGCLHGRKKWKDEAVTPNYRTCEHRSYFGHEEYICDSFKWHKDSVGHGVAVEMNNGEISVREGDCVGGFPGPLKNVWLGTSVENQATADERIPHLLNCPAAVRVLSIEPMLEAIDLRLCPRPDDVLACDRDPDDPYEDSPVACIECPSGRHWVNGSYVQSGYARRHCGIDWVIVGGESGPGARRMDLDWARNIRDQCQAAGVPLFVKQMGTYWDREGGRRGKGNNMADWPNDLRIRQMPATAERKE